MMNGDVWMNKKFFLHKLFIVAPMLIYMVVYLVWFGAVEKTDYSRCTEIHCVFDDMIPFCEFFIVPYLLWFIFVAAGIIYQLFADERRFAELCMVLISGMTIFLIISTIFPNILHLRPDTLPRDNIFSRMVENLYATDTPTNVMPSIHVYNTLAIMASLLRSKGKIAAMPAVKIPCLILSASIILATMFLKQHSVLDVTAATLMFIVCQGIFGTIFGSDYKRTGYQKSDTITT